MDRRNELLREEAEGWAELSELLARLDPRQMEQQGLTEDWTAKDLLAHLGAWLREASEELDRMIHLGTYEPTKLSGRTPRPMLPTGRSTRPSGTPTSRPCDATSSHLGPGCLRSSGRCRS